MIYQSYVLTTNFSFTQEYGTVFEFPVEEEIYFVPPEYRPVEERTWVESILKKITPLQEGLYQLNLEITNVKTSEKSTFSYKLRKGDVIPAVHLLECEGMCIGYLNLLIKIVDISDSAFKYEIIGIHEDDIPEEDWENILESYYQVGANLWYLPREAPYSLDITLKEIKKVGSDFELTIFVEACEEDDEDQTMTFTVNKGSILEWDELVEGVVCFVGPSREPVKLEVFDIDESGIMFRKIEE